MPLIESLRALLCPESLVIVGASADPNKVNGRPIRNLLRDGYAGRVYLVNPKYSDIMGFPCFPDVASLPEVPELGVVGVAAEGASEVVAALGRKGVKTAIVWSAGFAEMGAAGRDLEDKLTATARAHGMRLCGPNTLGLTNAFARMPLTFSQYADTPLQPGPVAFVSQSGAFGTAVATAARSRGIGLGYFVSTGNQADISVATVIDAVLDDSRIAVVVAYLEGLRDGHEFVLAARKAMALGKPLVVVKVGRHAAGSRAANSHTGSLAGDDAVFDSVMRQHGVLRADNEAHALDLTAALINCSVAEADGVGLITVSGGAGAMMADMAEELGLSVPVLGSDTQSRLAGLLRGFASTGNPVDVTGQSIEDVTILSRSLDLLMEDPTVAICVMWVQLLHGKAEQLANLLIDCKRKTTKPFVLCWLNSPAATVRRLREAGICVADSTLGGIQAAAGLIEYGRARKRLASRETVSAAAPRAPRRSITATENVASMVAARLLADGGLTVAAARLATSAEAAADAALGLGFPVAVKIESADLPHKTEAGGVCLNLADAGAVKQAYSRVLAAAKAYKPSARIDGVLVQAMEPAATELVLGLHRDPAFGPVLMVGLGGIFIEALKDVVFAVPPVSLADAHAMIGRLRCQTVLDGIRGQRPVDRESLARALCALSDLALRHPEIVELDLNPVFGSSGRTVAVDWLMVRDAHA
jgi:acetyltransferase